MIQTRRMTAKKVSIVEICNGKFIQKTGFESSYILTVFGRKLSRVRVLGLLVDKYIRDDGKYASVTLDDGTQTLRCKVFVNTKLFDSVTKGDLVDVFGKVKEYNGEIYVMPEIIKKADPNIETLRLLELEEVYKKQKQDIEKIKQLGTKDIVTIKKTLKNQIPDDIIEGIVESGCLDDKKKMVIEKPISDKDKILKIIEESEGIDYMTIIEKSGLDENKVDQAVQELLECGVCGEPSPGVIKKL